MTWCTQLDLFLNSAWSQTVLSMRHTGILVPGYLGPRPGIQSSIDNHWTSGIRDQVTRYSHAKATLDLVYPGSRNHVPFSASKIHYTFPRRPQSRVREFLLYGARISLYGSRMNWPRQDYLSVIINYSRGYSSCLHILTEYCRKLSGMFTTTGSSKCTPTVHAPIRGRLQITFDLQ